MTDSLVAALTLRILVFLLYLYSGALVKRRLPYQWSSPASAGGCGTIEPDSRRSPSLQVASTVVPIGFQFCSVLWVSS